MAVTGLRRLLDGLLFVLVVVSLGVLLLGRVLPLTGHQPLVVAGPSMGAAIPIGSAVILDRVPPSSLAVGDVVSLRSGPDKAIFTHRIIRLAERDGGLWLETQGDANPGPDPSLTSADAVLGRVGVWIPYAGYLLTWYSTPSGIIFVVSLGMVLLLLGISLEPQATRRRAGPLVPTEDVTAPALPLAAPSTTSRAPISVVHHASAREVVRASRERRSRRQAPGSATPSRRQSRA